MWGVIVVVGGVEIIGVVSGVGILGVVGSVGTFRSELKAKDNIFKKCSL